MLKKVLIGLGIVVILIVAFMLSYFFYFTRLASPLEEVKLSTPKIEVAIKYCRPSKKDRLIFGNEDEGALVSYGKYWRLGANQSTEIEFTEDALFGGKKILKGKYRMYAIPNEKEWAVRLNSELGVWGASEPDRKQDVLEVKVPVYDAPVQEMFTISLKETNSGMDMEMHWDKTKTIIPIWSLN